METSANLLVSCTANFAYEASQPDELSIKPGDVIHNVVRLSGGWWRGELKGKRGMFPDNFVTVMDSNSTRTSGVQGRCRAVFSYQPANPDELPLDVGDVLDVLGEVEEGWWQGRRQGRVGVFPSNFVVMLDAPMAPTAVEPAPALPPKPVKEFCRVLFPYAAVNDDELTLGEGDIVTIVSKDAPDRGWWRGELHGRVGLFPDNFVQMLPPVPQEVDEKKPDRPPGKSSIYPVVNKYTEKTSSIKELSTSKISLHKENTLSKESSTQSTIVHTNKSESEKTVHSESNVNNVTDDRSDGQVKKPPVPSKKSPTPSSGVGGLFSGLKNKMMSTEKTDKEKSSASTVSSSASNSSGEWDKTDGISSSRPAANANTFDHVERNSILNDPRAGRVKAPRRRPPSQSIRDETVAQIGLSNGHEVPTEKPPVAEKAEEIKPKAREWEKHRAPWMEELKLNQAKKTVVVTDVAKPKSSGSTDKLLECGVEEKRSSTHSMEMSKSTSSISSRISVLESFEETKVRHSLDSKKDAPTKENNAQSPTAAGRTFSTMVEEIKKPPAPLPPAASVRTSTEIKLNDKSNVKSYITTEKVIEKTSTLEKSVKPEEKPIEKPVLEKSGSTLERRFKSHDKNDGVDALIAQLNNRIINLEKLLEVQNAKFNAAIEDLNTKLRLETEKRQALQTEIEKLAHCVTQV